MKINEITAQLGISRKAILYYENEGLISSTRKTNNYREFDNAQIEKLKVIYQLRLAKIPVKIIKHYLITNNQQILEDHVLNRKKQLRAELNDINNLQIETLGTELPEPIKAVEYIKENIKGPFSDYLCSHYKYYFEKDNVTYHGNEQTFKQMIGYIESNNWDGVNQALVKYPQTELPASIEDISYKSVASLQSIPKPSEEILKQVQEVVSPVKAELEAINFYTTLVPLIRQLSPSYNLYLQKLEWLEANN